jgi:hypothetical protein
LVIIACPNSFAARFFKTGKAAAGKKAKRKDLDLCLISQKHANRISLVQAHADVKSLYTPGEIKCPKQFP